MSSCAGAAGCAACGYCSGAAAQRRAIDGAAINSRGTPYSHTNT